MLKRYGSMGLEVKIKDKLIMQNGFSDSDNAVNLMKAMCDYLSDENLNNRNVSSAGIVGYDGWIENYLIVFGDIIYWSNDFKEGQVHIFFPIEKKDKNETQQWGTDSFDINIKTLAIELINDIERDYDKWVYCELCDNEYETFCKGDPKYVEGETQKSAEDWIKKNYSEKEQLEIYKVIRERKERIDYWLNKLKSYVKS